MHLDWNRNIGLTDRIIRVIIGLLLLAPVISGAVKGLWAAAAGLVALFQFAEAYLAY